MELGLVAGVVGLGIVHGILPDHGWPIAATYALGFDRKWFRGTVAGLVLGIGHLISSVALVMAYFWISAFSEFAEGPYLKPLAGTLLVLLGVYEYVSSGHGDHDHDDHHGHDHGHGHGDHDGTADGHDHSHDGSASESGGESILARARSLLPGGGHSHLSEHHAREGLATLGLTALLLGFAHEEPVQILAICAGTEFCLQLMLVYSVAVIGAILTPTLLLIAGYKHYRERIERFTPYLPTLTAAVLVAVGLWFILASDLVAGQFASLVYGEPLHGSISQC